MIDRLAHAGFTSKQAYKMGIPAIGIVAVLVANVAFIAWSTPPGTNGIERDTAYATILPTLLWNFCLQSIGTALVLAAGLFAAPT